MNFTTSLSSFKKTLVAFLQRFHVLIFVIIVLNGSTVVIYILNNTTIKSGESSDYTPANNEMSFDQATIKRIEELKTRDQSDAKIKLPPGRTNPFVE
jgi:exopolysaccharide biosynthesis protein